MNLVCTCLIGVWYWRLRRKVEQNYAPAAFQRYLEEQRAGWVDQVKEQGEDVAGLMDAFMKRYRSDPAYREALVEDEGDVRSTRPAPDDMSIADEVY